MHSFTNELYTQLAQILMKDQVVLLDKKTLEIIPFKEVAVSREGAEKDRFTTLSESRAYWLLQPDENVYGYLYSSFFERYTLSEEVDVILTEALRKFSEGGKQEDFIQALFETNQIDAWTTHEQWVFEMYVKDFLRPYDASHLKMQ